MKSQLQKVIHLTKSLSLSDQIELLAELSAMMREAHSEKAQRAVLEDDVEFSPERFRTSWQQAVTGQTLPLSQLWEDVGGD